MRNVRIVIAIIAYEILIDVLRYWRYVCLMSELISLGTLWKFHDGDFSHQIFEQSVVDV